MDGMLAAFEQVAQELSYAPPAIPIISNVTGQLMAAGEVSTPGYWVRHARQAVRFREGIETLLAEGVATFLEVGPDSVLSGLGAECAAAQAPGAVPPAAFVAAQRSARPEAPALVTALAALHVRGVPVDWPAFYSRWSARTADLPTYAFQRSRYWLDASPGTAVPGDQDVLNAEADPAGTRFWEAVDEGDAGAVARLLGVSEDDPLRAVVPTLGGWHQRGLELAQVDRWRYGISWQPVPDSLSPLGAGTWLVVEPACAAGAAQAPDPGWLSACGSALADHGVTLVRMSVEVTTAERDGLARDLADIVAAIPDLRGVLCLLAADERPHPRYPQLPSALFATTALIQALGDAGIRAPVWCATRHGVAIAPGDPIVPAAAQIWGLGRVCGLELPHRWGGLVDLPQTVDARARSRLAAVLTGPDDEDQLAVRPSGVFARRLRHLPGGEAPAGAGWTPRGTVLITGGTGALGGHIARRLAREGADHLVLTSRSGHQAPGAVALAGELAVSGVRVSIEACDVADHDALAALVRRLTAQGTPVRAVVHTAGNGDMAALTDLAPADLARVMSAKVAGADNLNRIFAGQPLEAFILFSSVAGAWGSAGQGGYAAANAHLDALAQWRRARGLAASSLAWGPWAGAGMSAGAEESLLRHGVIALRPGQAMTALMLAVRRGDTSLILADMDWRRFFPGFTAARPRPLLRDLPEVAVLESMAGPVAGDGDGRALPQLRQAVADVPAAESHAIILRTVRAEAAAVLGHSDPEAVEALRAFQDAGFDSLMAVELRDRLSAVTGLKLPATLLFDYPTPEGVARFVADALCPPDKEMAPSALGELERFHEAYFRAPMGADERALVVARLRRLVTTWADNADGDQEASLANRIQAATADEVFAFIDQDLRVGGA